MQNEHKATATLVASALLAAGTLPSITPFTNFLATSTGGMILGLLNHGFIAATIGGLADWFAVTALFRKPLGISYRTEILKRNRQHLTDALVEFVGEDLLTTSNIMETLKEENAAQLLIEFFERYNGRQKTKDLVYEILAELLANVDSEKLSKEITPTVEQEVKNFDVRKVIDAAVKVTTDEKHSRKILASLFETGHKIFKSAHMQNALHKKIVELRTAYEGDSAGRAMVLSSMNLTDEKILSILNENVDEKIRETVDALRAKGIVDAEKATVAQNLTSAFERAIKAVTADIDTENFQAEFGKLFSDRIDLESYVRNWLESTLKCESTTVILQQNRISIAEKIWRPTIDRLVDEKIDEFIKSKELQGKFDRLVKDAIEGLLEDYHEQIPTLIRERLDRFSDDELTKFVEGKVFDDLQMIRINGSVCGAAVGMLLYAATLLADKIVG